MKRTHAKLSFDDEEASASSGDERPLCARRAPRGLPGACQGTSKNDDSASSALLLREALGQLRSRTQSTAPDSPEKKFAWMDSDDDDDDGAASEAKDCASDVELAEVPLPMSMREIGTFSEFVRFTPAIKKAVAEFPAAELVALCKTAARLKYFDGDLFETVFHHLILRLRALEFDATQITSMAADLVDLNAYNANFFSAAASCLLPKVSEMPKEQRLQWIKLLASANHNGDDAFVEKLRTAPLLPGEEGSAEYDFNLCWQFINGGFCPRGNSCKWFHPAKKK